MSEKPTMQLAACGTAVMLVIFFAYFGNMGWNAFHQPATSDPEAETIRVTGFYVAILWACSWQVSFDRRRVSRSECSWDKQSVATWSGRLLYSLGGLLCLFHIAVAFHVGHEWSHRKAFEHTERASGFGWGVWVNYAFALIWAADLAWMWLAYDHFLKRPRWLRWAIVGFMGFIVFNAAFVFGSGVKRWVWLAMFTFVASFSMVSYVTRSASRRD